MTDGRERFECIVTRDGASLSSPDGGREAWAFDPAEDGFVSSACRETLASRNPRLARLDDRARAALLAVHLAIRRAADSGVTVVDPSRVFVWTAVEHGSEPADRAFWETARGAGGALASPMYFAATLPSAVAGEIALTFGLRGPSIVTTGDGDDVPEDALVAMAGAVDIVVTVSLRGWESSGATRATATVRRA